MKMKKVIICFIVFTTIFTFTSIALANNKIKANGQAISMFEDEQKHLKGRLLHNKLSDNQIKRMLSVKTDFIKLPTKYNIRLDKMWTVKFNRRVKTYEIDAIVIQHGVDFVPVNITIAGTDKVTVTPERPYIGGEKYSMKIFLSNGKKYSMDFYTEDEARWADTGKNTRWQDAARVTLGETIKGSLTKNENESDWYRLDVGRDTDISITLRHLEGEIIGIYL